MKPTLTLLLCLAVLRGFAQDTACVRKNHPVLEISLISFSVISGALGDGLNSRANYGIGHLAAAASIASLIAVPFVVKPNWKFPVTYLLLRYALFDAFYNVGAKRNLNYIGGKNYYDETVGKMPLSVFNFSKIASIGVVILINAKNNKK